MRALLLNSLNNGVRLAVILKGYIRHYLGINKGN